MVEGSTLQLARTHVRTRTRTPRYLEHGDRFAAAFLGAPLGVPAEYCRSVGTDLAAILDTCYEQLVPQGERAASTLKGTSLALFSDTGAAAMTLVGGLPFAERFSGEDQAALVRFMKATPELLDLVNGLLRLAQDVTFDDSEPVSALAAATASERRGSTVPP